jgi:integrase
VLTTFFGWAIGEGFIDENPVAYTNKPEAGKPRDRVLKNEELAAVWNACGDDDYGKIIRLLILTGARRDEIAAMQWRELDRDNRTWTLPPERAKNDRELKLTLPGLAWDIIDSTKRRVLKDHLFGIGKNGFRNWAHPRRSWMSAAVYRTGLTTTCAVRLRRE